MADKKRKPAETEGGFFELIPTTDVNRKSKRNAVTSHKVSRPKGKKKQTEMKGKLLYWCYDDKHTVGYLLRIKDSEGEIKYSRPKLLTAKDIEDEIDKVQKELKAKKKESLDLPVGTENFHDTFSNRRKLFEMIFHSSPDDSLDISGFEEFRKLTLEGSSRTERIPVLKIICVILSSYIIRSMLNIPEILETYRLDKKELRAFHVNISTGENAFYSLKQLCQAMIICTSAKEDDYFKLTVPTIISPETDQPILDLAHLDVDGCKKHHWPAPYRDTSVLLDTRNLKSGDMESFAKRNPWCSCIIYGKKQSKTSVFGYGEDIKGDVLVNIFPELDTDKIQNLIKTYAIYTPVLFRDQSKEFVATWIQSGIYLGKHISKHKSVKWKDSVKFRYRVEVSALLSFLNFAKEKCSVPEDAMADFQNSLLDVLLPGCLTEKQTDTASVQSRSPQETLDELLQKMLTAENLKYFSPLPDKNGVIWPLKTEHGDPIWGYIKHHHWQKNDLEKSACLVFPREQLLQAAKHLVPDTGSFTDVLASFQKEKPPYMHPTTNAKVKREGEEQASSRTAYRLKIEELPIDENIKQQLLAMAIK